MCMCVCVCVCARARARGSFVRDRVQILETKRNIIISFLVAQLGSMASGASTHNGHNCQNFSHSKKK